jgi:hypothetical protein
MIKVLFDWVRKRLGHYLLADEEADDLRRQQELARKQREIIEASYETEDTARDLDSGEF